jgi:hypothetical protein
MSFLYGNSNGGGGGGIQFNNVVEILESDNTVTIRHMTPNGGIYPSADVHYDDDTNSFDFGDEVTDGMTFLDAVDDEMNIGTMYGDDNNMDFFQSNRYVQPFECGINISCVRFLLINLDSLDLS